MTLALPAGNVENLPLAKFAGRLLVQQRGCAVRVLSVARLPQGTGAVVMQEAVKISGDNVILDARPKCGANIRYAGSELAAGREVLRPVRRWERDKSG